METNKPKKHAFKLKEKHVIFLKHLATGMKVSDAHKLAGFSGKPESAYTLRHKLKVELSKMQEDQGFSRVRIIGEALKLLDLPCVDGFGRPVKGISVEQRIKVMAFIESLLPEKKRAPLKLVPFLILRSDSPKPLGQVIDVKEIPAPALGRRGDSENESKKLK